MKDEPQLPIHEHEHAVPTVIHHPEEDMTALARWLQRGMEQGPRFWFLMGGAIVAVVAVFVLASSLSAGRAADGQAWTQLIPAKTVDDRLKVAEDFPNTPVAHWARLQAAAEEYQEGLYALVDPKQRDLVGTLKLKKALGYFKQVATDAAKDSPLSLSAGMGVARTLEALNDLPGAIKQYKLVAETYPGTPEAKQAEALARTLEDPESATFYRELYSYKASDVKTPASSAPGSIFDLARPPGSEFIVPGAGKSFLPDMKPPTDLAAPPTPSPTPSPTLEPPKTETPAQPSEPPITPAKPTDVPVIPPGGPASPK